MAAMLVAFAAPALANDHNDWDWNDRHNNDRWWWDWNDNDRWWDNRFDRFDFDDRGFFFGDNEQSAESGDVDQSFDVSGTGDNSNQTAGIQGVANTGNAQNQLGVTDFGNFDNDNGDRWWNDRWWNDDDQLLTLLIIRTRRPFFSSRIGRYLLVATLAIAVVTVALPYTPLAAPLDFAPLPLAYLLVLWLIAASYAATTEIAKIFYARSEF
jgi:hypothetical protein